MISSGIGELGKLYAEVTKMWKEDPRPNSDFAKVMRLIEERIAELEGLSCNYFIDNNMLENPSEFGHNGRRPEAVIEVQT